MSFDPDIVVMNQVCIKLCHSSFRNATEEYYQTTFFHHLKCRLLCCCGWVSRNNFVCAFSVCQFFNCCYRILIFTVDNVISAKLFYLIQTHLVDVDHDNCFSTT